MPSSSFKNIKMPSSSFKNIMLPSAFDIIRRRRSFVGAAGRTFAVVGLLFGAAGRTFVGAAERTFAVVGLFRRKNTVVGGFESCHRLFQKVVIAVGFFERKKISPPRLSRENIVPSSAFKKEYCRRRLFKDTAVVGFVKILPPSASLNIAVVGFLKILPSSASLDTANIRFLKILPPWAS